MGSNPENKPFDLLGAINEIGYTALGAASDYTRDTIVPAITGLYEKGKEFVNNIPAYVQEHAARMDAEMEKKKKNPQTLGQMIKSTYNDVKNYYTPPPGPKYPVKQTKEDQMWDMMGGGFVFGPSDAPEIPSEKPDPRYMNNSDFRYDDAYLGPALATLRKAGVPVDDPKEQSYTDFNALVNYLYDTMEVENKYIPPDVIAKNWEVFKLQFQKRNSPYFNVHSFQHKPGEAEGGQVVWVNGKRYVEPSEYMINEHGLEGLQQVPGVAVPKNVFGETIQTIPMRNIGPSYGKEAVWDWTPNSDKADDAVVLHYPTGIDPRERAEAERKNKDLLLPNPEFGAGQTHYRYDKKTKTYKEISNNEYQNRIAAAIHTGTQFAGMGLTFPMGLITNLGAAVKDLPKNYQKVVEEEAKKRSGNAFPQLDEIFDIMVTGRVGRLLNALGKGWGEHRDAAHEFASAWLDPSRMTEVGKSFVNGYRERFGDLFGIQKDNEPFSPIKGMGEIDPAFARGMRQLNDTAIMKTVNYLMELPTDFGKNMKAFSKEFGAGEMTQEALNEIGTLAGFIALMHGGKLGGKALLQKSKNVLYKDLLENTVYGRMLIDLSKEKYDPQVMGKQGMTFEDVFESLKKQYPKKDIGKVREAAQKIFDKQSMHMEGTLYEHIQALRKKYPGMTKEDAARKLAVGIEVAYHDWVRENLQVKRGTIDEIRNRPDPKSAFAVNLNRDLETPEAGRVMEGFGDNRPNIRMNEDARLQQDSLTQGLTTEELYPSQLVGQHGRKSAVSAFDPSRMKDFSTHAWGIHVAEPGEAASYSRMGGSGGYLYDVGTLPGREYNIIDATHPPETLLNPLYEKYGKESFEGLWPKDMSPPDAQHAYWWLASDAPGGYSQEAISKLLDQAGIEGIRYPGNIKVIFNPEKTKILSAYEVDKAGKIGMEDVLPKIKKEEMGRWIREGKMIEDPQEPGMFYKVSDYVKKYGPYVTPAIIGAIATSTSEASEDWGNRTDGTKKGQGWLGPHYFTYKKDGKIYKGVSSELSVTATIDGNDILIPTMVPGLTKQEIKYLIDRISIANDPDALYTPEGKAIMRKAIEHARKRISEGKSPFKEDR